MVCDIKSFGIQSTSPRPLFGITAGLAMQLFVPGPYAVLICQTGDLAQASESDGQLQSMRCDG